MRWGNVRAATATETLHGERLNFLTDGVYAIVATLLVLEVKVPEDLAEGAILPALEEALPRFVAFAIAFNAAATGWTLTYLTNSIISRANFGHLMFTLLSLFFVSLIPFASAMMGSYPHSPWGYVPYCMVITALTATYALDLLLAARSLVPQSFDARLVRILWLSLAGCAAYCSVVGAFVAFWSTRAALWAIIAASAAIWIEYLVMVRMIGRELARTQAAGHIG